MALISYPVDLENIILGYGAPAMEWYNLHTQGKKVPDLPMSTLTQYLLDFTRAGMVEPVKVLLSSFKFPLLGEGLEIALRKEFYPIVMLYLEQKCVDHDRALFAASSTGNLDWMRYFVNQGARNFAGAYTEAVEAKMAVDDLEGPEVEAKKKRLAEAILYLEEFPAHTRETTHTVLEIRTERDYLFGGVAEWSVEKIEEALAPFEEMDDPFPRRTFSLFAQDGALEDLQRLQKWVPPSVWVPLVLKESSMYGRDAMMLYALEQRSHLIGFKEYYSILRETIESDNASILLHLLSSFREEIPHPDLIQLMTMAINEDRFNIAKLLLQEGTNPQAAGIEAARQDHREIFEYIIEYYGSSITPDRIFDTAAISGNLKLTEDLWGRWRLVLTEADLNATLLGTVVQPGNLEVVKYLITQGASNLQEALDRATYQMRYTRGAFVEDIIGFLQKKIGS